MKSGWHHTEETKQKIRQDVIARGAWKNLKTPEAIKKNAESKRGGRLTKQHRQRISEGLGRAYAEGRRSSLPKVPWNKGLKGRHFSPESELKKGNIPWNKGKTGIYTQQTIEKIRAARMRQRFPLMMTKPEQRFLEICEKHKLPYKHTGNGNFWIGNINPDFVNINGKKEAVDIFGTYWHSPLFNPHIQPWAELQTRTKMLKDYGWKLIVFWENEITETNVLTKLGVEP